MLTDNLSALLPTTIPSTIIATTLLVALSYMLLYPTQLLRWLQRKRYQYEVTFSLYMLTPTEKFIFNSILFLILSLLSIGVFLYLPEHIATVANRAFYYIAGDETATSSVTSVPQKGSVATALAETTGRVVGEAVRSVSAVKKDNPEL